MRFDRTVAAKFESRGHPGATKIVEGDIPTVMRAYADWLRGVTMGSRIVLTMAKDAAALGQPQLGGSAGEIADLFEAQFGGEI